MRGLASEGQRPRRGGNEGAAGAMEGVLYKWTNYLSGEWGAPRPLSEQPEGDVGTRLLGVGVTAPPGPTGTCADPSVSSKRFAHRTAPPVLYRPTPVVAG